MSLFQPPSREPHSQEPDWQALADSHEAGARRKRRLAVAGAVVGALVVIGGVFALVSSGGSADRRAGSNDSTGISLPGGASTMSPGSGSQGFSSPGTPGSPGASGAGTPGASGSASANASPGTAGPSASASGPGSTTGPTTGPASGSASATALSPLNAGAVLYAQELYVGNRVYKRVLTDEKSPCWTATTGHLGDALAPNRCAQLLRATWVSGNREVSVGVAVLPTAGEAQAANAAYVGHIEPLRGGPAPGFCPDNSPCALAHGVEGHFTYYVIAGPVGSAPGVDDAASRAAAQRFAAFAVTALARQA